MATAAEIYMNKLKMEAENAFADKTKKKKKKQTKSKDNLENEEDEDDEDDDDDDEEEEEGNLEDLIDQNQQHTFKFEGDEDSETLKTKEIRKEKKLTFKWWVKPSIVYAFRHPVVTSRLEKLMGSNRVPLTDRDYMQKLQQRIQVEYANSAEKRIKAREVEEMRRVKNLFLTGKVPFANAPPEMYDHPVMVIERYCQKLIAARRAKIKVPKVNIPNHLYWDDTIDPPSGLSIENGHMFRHHADRVCVPPDAFLESPDEEDIKNGFMLTDEEFDTLRYEDPKIKELKECQNVEDLYRLADEVIGGLKTPEINTKLAKDNLSTYTNSTDQSSR